MLSLSDIVNVKVGIGRGVFEAPGATVIGGKKPSFNLEILKLFANGEQGFWYDPSDMGTMFQDAAGTVPVTGVGQPVGLMLDKSKGLVLSGELAVNGDVSSGTTNWYTGDPNSTVSATAGRIRTVLSGTSNPRTSLNVSGLNIGKWYSVSLDFFKGTLSGGGLIRASSNTGLSTGTVVEVQLSESKTAQTLMFPATATTMYIGCVGLTSTVGQYFELDNISVKELSGNHAHQTTTAARPILRDTSRRIGFDTVDDKLITNLPAQLTGCTVVRSVPNVGTQILTNQTIPATYEDNKDHCGLIVINRALTPSETSAIAAEFKRGLVYEI